jgi:hypothetical protein
MGRHHFRDFEPRHGGERRRTPARRWRRRSRNGQFLGQVAGLALFAGVVTWNAAPQLSARWAMAQKSPEEIARIEASAYYRNCDAARAAGVAPIDRGEPGYRPEMDGDSDGIACEPYRGY